MPRNPALTEEIEEANIKKDQEIIRLKRSHLSKLVQKLNKKWYNFRSKGKNSKALHNMQVNSVSLGRRSIISIMEIQIKLLTPIVIM